jgi:hypothetical protein
MTVWKALKVTHLGLPLMLLCLVFSLNACGWVKDVPQHSTEEVVAIARSFSPDCKLKVGEERHG